MRLHVANTYFESELCKEGLFSPANALEQSPIYRHLQWLPFFYADPEEGVLVTRPPPAQIFSDLPLFSSPHCVLLSEAKFSSYHELVSWGTSASLAAWAKKQQLLYSMPPWEVVRQVNSKEFSFLHAPQLPGSALLRNREEALDWIAKQKGSSVLKTCFGVSGRGHLHLPENHSKLSSFLQQGWPIIGEPWVRRSIDFSTQWEILQPNELRYLGTTLCDNDAKGRYLQTRVGNVQLPFGFEEHCVEARRLLQLIARFGYFGNVGFDAMLYEDSKGKLQLHPIVEINARKTMGWVALEIQKRFFYKRSVAISFCLTRKEPAVIIRPWTS